MPVPKVKPLKIEDLTNGDDLNMLPTETDPTEDYLAAKGISLENSDDTIIQGNSGIMQFKDSEVTGLADLKDLAERLKYQDVDLASLTDGYVLTWNDGLSKFDLQPTGGAGGGNGVTPPFIFSKSGNATSGTYLRTGEAVTSTTGQIIKGNNLIVEIAVSNGNAVGTNTVIQLQRRTAISTFTDIVGASVTITSGNYKASATGLSVAFGPDEEMSAYVKSGSTLSNPVLVVYMSPA